jgi:hypothetical protein
VWERSIEAAGLARLSEPGRPGASAPVGWAVVELRSGSATVDVQARTGDDAALFEGEEVHGGGDLLVPESARRNMRSQMLLDAGELLQVATEPPNVERFRLTPGRFSRDGTVSSTPGPDCKCWGSWPCVPHSSRLDGSHATEAFSSRISDSTDDSGSGLSSPKNAN